MIPPRGGVVKPPECVNVREESNRLKNKMVVVVVVCCLLFVVCLFVCLFEFYNFNFNLN